MDTALNLQTRFQPTLQSITSKITDWQSQADRVSARFQQILAPYTPISLKNMNAVALLNRTDTKYVLHFDQLTQALQALARQYDVLQIENRRLHHYHNLYFETPQFNLFYQHQRGQRDRYKIRCRKYLDSQIQFLEIKRKNNRNRTLKTRLQTDHFVESFSENQIQFLQENTPLSPYALNPVLWNDFQRLTFVSKTTVERLTIDINLQFSDGWNQVGLPGVAVAEVKQDGFSNQSDFISQMRRLSLPPRRFSKYCLGITLFYPTVKANRFKPRTTFIERLIRQNQEILTGA